MRTRGPKARGHISHTKMHLSDERPHKKPIMENHKTHRVKPIDKRAAMIFMDSH